MARNNRLRPTFICQRANLADDAGKEIRRQMVLWFFLGEKCQSWNVKTALTKALNFACNNLAFQIEHGSSKCKIKERLLPITQVVK